MSAIRCASCAVSASASSAVRSSSAISTVSIRLSRVAGASCATPPIRARRGTSISPPSRVELAPDQPEQRGLARAVAPDESDLVPRRDQRGGVVEELLALHRKGDVLQGQHGRACGLRGGREVNRLALATKFAGTDRPLSARIDECLSQNPAAGYRPLGPTPPSDEECLCLRLRVTAKSLCGRTFGIRSAVAQCDIALNTIGVPSYKLTKLEPRGQDEPDCGRSGQLAGRAAAVEKTNKMKVRPDNARRYSLPCRRCWTPRNFSQARRFRKWRAAFRPGMTRADLWLTCEVHSRAIGFCYAAAEPMTDGAWNMHALAVLPSLHGKGYGGAIVARLEAELRRRNQRILIADTSGAKAVCPNAQLLSQVRLQGSCPDTRLLGGGGRQDRFLETAGIGRTSARACPRHAGRPPFPALETRANGPLARGGSDAPILQGVVAWPSSVRSRSSSPTPPGAT